VILLRLPRYFECDDSLLRLEGALTHLHARRVDRNHDETNSSVRFASPAVKMMSP
jgi:hypothetical protein